MKPSERWSPFRRKHAIEIGSRVPSDGIMWRLQADHEWKHETGDEMVIRGLDTNVVVNIWQDHNKQNLDDIG